MSKAHILDLDELNDLDMSGIDGKVNRTLIPGKFLFRHVSAEIKQGEDKQGNDRLELHLRSSVAAVIATDDKDANPKDFVGQSIFERFYAPTTENLGYVKQYFDNVMGAKVKDKFSAIIELLNSGDIMFIARVNGRKWQGKDQADLTREPNHFTGFEKLTEEQLALADNA